MNSDPKTAFDLYVAIFTFGSLIAGGAFWLATWRSQILLKELQLQLREEQISFREDFQRTLDQSNEGFRLDVQKSLDNYRYKIGILKNKITEIELFLNKNSNYNVRREPPADSFPTDFRSEK